MFILLIFFCLSIQAAVSNEKKESDYIVITCNINDKNYSISQEIITHIVNKNISTLLSFCCTSQKIRNMCINLPFYKNVLGQAMKFQLRHNIDTDYSQFSSFLIDDTWTVIKDTFLNLYVEGILQYSPMANFNKKEEKDSSKFNKIEKRIFDNNENIILYFSPHNSLIGALDIKDTAIQPSDLPALLSKEQKICRVQFSKRIFDGEWIRVLLKLGKLNKHIIFEDCYGKPILNYLYKKNDFDWFNKNNNLYKNNVHLSVRDPLFLCEFIINQNKYKLLDTSFLITNENQYKLLEICLKEKKFSKLDFFRRLREEFKKSEKNCKEKIHTFLTILLKHGFNPNLIYSDFYPRCSDRRRYPLYVFCYYNLCDFIELFIEYGADLNLYKGRRNSEVPMLWDACLSKTDKDKTDDTYNMCKFLLKKGMSPNDQDSGGNSALHFLNQFSYRIFKLFLKYDADLLLQNTNLKTPLSLIREIESTYTMKKCIKLLQQYNHSVSLSGKSRIKITKENKEVTLLLHEEINVEALKKYEATQKDNI